ncbi:MAG: restriction endonuclease subunit S [Patescibacteria group bacterium]
MNKDWKQTTLGEVAGIITGGTPPSKYPECYGSMYPFITPTDISDASAFCLTQRFLSEVGRTRFKSRVLPKNSICFTCIASIGKICLTTQESFTNQQINSLIVDSSKADYRFIYYLLKYLTPNIKSQAGGTITGIINKSSFSKTEIDLPDLNIQRSIADTLWVLDDKIELLRDQNKTLEEMAQRLFKEWFVDFNFPNADGKPYKASGGKMVESEMGEIPEGWRVGKLGSEFDISIGRTPPRLEQQWFSDVPIGKKWISIKDIGNSETYISNTSEYLTDEAIDRFNIPIIPDGTTILSFKMTVGKLAITTEEMLSNEAIAHLKIKSNSIFSSEYIYLYLKGLDFNSLGSTSSIVTAINSTMIKALEILIPADQVLLVFDQFIKPIFAKEKNNNFEIQTLSKLRDTMLPKLMSGVLQL